MEKKNSQTIKIVVGVIGGIFGLLVVFFILLVLFVKLEERELAEEFVLHLAADEYEEAYNVTSPSFQNEYDVQYLVDLVNENSVLDEATGVNFDAGRHRMNTYSVTGKILSDSGTLPVMMELHQNEIDEWEIVFFSVDPADMPVEDVDEDSDGFSIFGSEKKDVARDFIDYLADDDYEEAYELTSSEFKVATSLEGLQTFAEGFYVVDNAVDVKFNYTGYDNGVHSLSGTLYAEDGSTSPVTMEFVKEGGAMKVSFISLLEEDVPSFND